MRRAARDLKEVVAKQTREFRLLKKSRKGSSRQIAWHAPAGQWTGATKNEVRRI